MNREPRMHRITSPDDWCECDRLNRRSLQGGEILEVEFPDGHRAVVKIVMRAVPKVIQDHGNTSEYHDLRAGIELNHHGLTAWLRLPHGTKARRIEQGAG